MRQTERRPLGLHYRTARRSNPDGGCTTPMPPSKAIAHGFREGYGCGLNRLMENARNEIRIEGG